jgi:hypothetical protein
MDDVERVARAIWAKRPDVGHKPWPIESDKDARHYQHHPMAAIELCYIYARAAIAALSTVGDT